ncbi:MAG: CDP-diacylglycerol--serine O-phosphatidyltransferase [Deltaproteobacteria bacterium]|nr:CDP-diacylglycerol--serine O-phosphatidyltransferase [Deltaproteobacteria bacterium]
MTPRLLAPTILTLANISAGFVAILAASEDRFQLAIWLVVGAILLDGLDGRVARRLGATSDFGRQLDSFSDAVSCGVAPAFLIYRAVLGPLGVFGAAIAVLYLLAGVARLTRFNLTSDVHKKARRTVGVPIPIAAGYMLALVAMRAHLAPEVAAATVAVLALLMVSRWHLPELRGDVVGIFILLGLAAYFTVLVHPGWVTVAVWNAWNVVILVVAGTLEHRLRRTRSAPVAADTAV